MSNYQNKHNDYVLCMEQLVGRLSGTLSYFIITTELDNIDSIKALLKSAFDIMPDVYFDNYNGGTTIEVDQLLKLINEKPIEKKPIK